MCVNEEVVGAVLELHKKNFILILQFPELSALVKKKNKTEIFLTIS